MVRHKQPKSLYQLCHQWFSEYLCEKVVSVGYGDAARCNHALSNVRQRLRPFFIEHLPAMVRTTLLHDTGELLFHRAQLAGVDCDYGRSLLYLLYLLFTREVRSLKVTLCCYYGCRDMEGALRCIKKHGGSLERLQLCRSSLLRMDPLLFRNVLTSATHLSSLSVRNICSDAMLKLIGTHSRALRHLDIASSKQVSDAGIESLCCQVHVVDGVGMGANGIGVGGTSLMQPPPTSSLTVQEDYSSGAAESSMGCAAIPSWRDLRDRMRHCLGDDRGGGSSGGCGNGDDGGADGIIVASSGCSSECLVSVRHVLHPLCHTLLSLDLTDTSVTNAGLLLLLRKVPRLTSLGEYTVSDHFLRTTAGRFALTSAHTRKLSSTGAHRMTKVLPKLNSLTCWQPAFDIADLARMAFIRQITLLRIGFSESMLRQIITYLEAAATNMEKIALEFVMQDEQLGFNVPVNPPEFDLSRVLAPCRRLRLFTLEFKDSLLLTRPVAFNAFCDANGVCGNGGFVPVPSLANLVHVQLGQVVRNSAVAILLGQCPRLKHLHCNHCPDLTDQDLSACLRAPDDSDLDSCKSPLAATGLECFYVYEAPGLSLDAFHMLLGALPDLRRFGNLTRWAVNCEGIQQVVRAIRENNYDVEILCGSHWFASQCSSKVPLSNAC